MCSWSTDVIKNGVKNISLDIGDAYRSIKIVRSSFKTTLHSNSKAVGRKFPVDIFDEPQKKKIYLHSKYVTRNCSNAV